MIVPTRVKGGVSGARSGATTVWVSGPAGAAGILERRDAEKSGRSRVQDSFEMGMAHKGFPVTESAACACPVSADAPPFKSDPMVSVSIAASETAED